MAVAAAGVLRALLTRLAGDGLPTYITFYPAVMLSALLGGVGPGLLASLVAALGVDYFLLAPMGSLAVASLADAVSLAFFTGTGVFMSVVAELYRRARQPAADEPDALSPPHPVRPPRWSRQGLLLNAGLVGSLAILAAVGWRSAQNLRSVARADELEIHSRVVIQELDRLLSSLKDAETGQRGYLLTGETNYLEPYLATSSLIQSNLAGLKQLIGADAPQQQRLAALEPLILAKTAILKQTIDLRRTRGLAAALAVVNTDQGKMIMDQIRRLVGDARDGEERLLQQRITAKQAGAGQALQALLAGGVLSFLLLITVFLYLKQENQRRRQAEADVRHHRDHLQELVAARTAELARSNDQLAGEIREHQQAREDLRQQREWLRVTLTSIGDAVLATDTAGRITFLNPVAQALTGWPESEVLGRPGQSVFRLVNEQTRAPGGDIIAQVLCEGRRVALANHTALLARDGREIPIEDSAAPIQDAGGLIAGVVLVFHDVTQKRRAEEALHESRERLDLALLSARMATFDWDIVANRRTWSPGVHRLLGTNPETFTGTAEEFFNIIHPDDRGAVQAALARAVEKTGVYETEYRAVWPDGHLCHIAARGKIQRDRTGRAVFMTGVCWDITERKQAEAAIREQQRQNELLAGILEHSSQPFGVGYPDGRLGLVNPAFERLTGYRRDELQSLNWTEVLTPPEWRELEQRKLEELALTGQPVRYEKEYLRKDGSRVPIELLVGLATEDGGKPLYYYSFLTDITARKRAEEALARLAAIVESSEDAILSKDLDGIITSWNAGAGRLFGYRPEEIIGRSIRLLLPPERQDEEAPIMARLLAGEHVDHFETVRLTKPGRPLAVSVTLSPLKDGRGRIIGASKIVRDITDRKARETELQTLNRTLKALHESSQAMARAVSESQYLQQVCQEVVANCGHAMVWIGYAESDKAKTVRPVASAGFEAGYLETLQVTWAEDERGRGPTGTAIRTGEPCACRNMQTDPAFAPWRAEALRRGYAASLVLPLLADGGAFGAITIYSRSADAFSPDEIRLLTQLAGDVSFCIRSLRAVARRQSAEEQLRLLSTAVESAVQGIVITDRDGQILWVNPAFSKLTGYSRDEAVGRNPRILQSGQTPREYYRAMWGSLLNGEPWHGELINRHKDGSLHPEEITITPVKMDGVQTTHYVAIKQDISERRRVQAALAQSAEEVRRSNRDLEQFAYIASHDLQEPLRAVGGYVKLLQRRFPENMDPKALEYINGAAEGAARMERLITDLLAFSRVGTHGGAFAPADLNANLDEALQNLAAKLASTRAIVTRDPLPTLVVDATQIMRLFQNLIGNAVKFQGERPPEIHVGVEKQPDRWVFSVRDNGIGIESQYFDRIFQIFQRLHTRRHYPGTGIGLAICKKIVERHQGDIWVESVTGQGSTFYFSLPDHLPVKPADL